MRELSHALVLGGSGFIGSWLVERLLEEGVEVSVLDPATPRIPPGSPVRHIDADVTEQSVEEALAQAPADAVFHLANAALVPPSVDRLCTALRALRQAYAHGPEGEDKTALGARCSTTAARPTS